jgi:hypothetical protein
MRLSQTPQIVTATTTAAPSVKAAVTVMRHSVITLFATVFGLLAGE